MCRRLGARYSAMSNVIEFLPLLRPGRGLTACRKAQRGVALCTGTIGSLGRFDSAAVRQSAQIRATSPSFGGLNVQQRRYRVYKSLALRSGRPERSHRARCGRWPAARVSPFPGLATERTIPEKRRTPKLRGSSRGFPGATRSSPTSSAALRTRRTFSFASALCPESRCCRSSSTRTSKLQAFPSSTGLT